jgi:hypothetical protein
LRINKQTKMVAPQAPMALRIYCILVIFFELADQWIGGAAI